MIVERPPAIRRQVDRSGSLDPAIDTKPWPGRRSGPALLVLLGVTAVAYLWDLSASGYANSFYAAAVQAGTESWKAFFFGSIDRSNFITVDKPPASLWVMELSGRIFGFSSWSLLAPQAVEGVAAVGLLYAGVKRWFGAPAGLLAGAVLAATPVAALMFRFDNPDALLVLLLVAAAYTLTRAIEKAGTGWIVATGSLVGFAFLTKMLQAFTVLPAFGLVYLIAAPTGLRRRLAQLAIAAAAIVVSAGWWVAIVDLWPAGSRPMIDGSPDNSIINLILGYNGLERLYSSSAGGQGGNFSGATGFFRLFNDLMGGQASWLIPAALVVSVAGIAAARRAPRTDRTRAALILWGGWLLVTGLVFSFGQGVIHTYYTVALAPAIGALVGIGGALLWQHRNRIVARILGALAIEFTAIWAYVLLDRTPTYHPWLRTLILLAGSLANVVLIGANLAGRSRRRLVVGFAGLALVGCLSAPVAFAATTVTSVHTGSIPSAGPTTTSNGIGGGQTGPVGAGAGRLARGPHSIDVRDRAASGPTGKRRATAPASGHAATGGTAPSAQAGASGGGARTSQALISALRSDAGSYRWVAAVSGSQSAATIELSANEPVMAIGGFSGEGGNITLARFEAYAKSGDIHYFIASGTAGGGPGGTNRDSTIAAWVAAHYKSEVIDGQTVYDLTTAK